MGISSQNKSTGDDGHVWQLRSDASGVAGSKGAELYQTKGMGRSGREALSICSFQNCIQEAEQEGLHSTMPMYGTGLVSVRSLGRG